MHSTQSPTRFGARRQSCAVLAAALFLAMGAAAQAQTAPYPNKPVRVVVAFTAGGTPAALGQFTQKEFEKWRALVRESGATAD